MPSVNHSPARNKKTSTALIIASSIHPSSPGDNELMTEENARDERAAECGRPT